MRLHVFLAANRDEVMHRWKERVRGTLALYAIPTVELVDQLPQFVDEIIAMLRAGTRTSGRYLSTDDSTTAAEHGTQRLRLGFSLDAVVREYGALRDALIATAVDAGIQPDLAELQIVFDCIIVGIAHAVSDTRINAMPSCAGRRTNTSPSSLTSSGIRWPRPRWHSNN